MASLWRLGGPWANFGTLGSITKESLRSRPRFLQILSGFWCPWYRPGGPWDDPGTLGTTRQDLVRSRLGFYRFVVDLGDLFKEIFGYIWTEKHDFLIFISRSLFLMILGSESGCLGSENQAFGKEGIAKINFC